MTKKDYVAIAKVLNSAYVVAVYGSQDKPNRQSRIWLMDTVLSGLCKVFKADNPQFSIDKFREAARDEIVMDDPTKKAT